MSETVGDYIDLLSNSTDNYAVIRNRISDDFVNMVREMMPRDYERFAKKEEAYQHTLETIGNL